MLIWKHVSKAYEMDWWPDKRNQGFIRITTTTNYTPVWELHVQCSSRLLQWLMRRLVQLLNHGQQSMMSEGPRGWICCHEIIHLLVDLTQQAINHRATMHFFWWVQQISRALGNELLPLLDFTGSRMSSTHHAILYQLPTFHLMTGSSRHQLPRIVGKATRGIFEGLKVQLWSRIQPLRCKQIS